MRLGEIIREILAHICVICSIAVFVLQILDWYNPYMDFMGHSVVVLYILCLSALLSGISQIFSKRKSRIFKKGC